MVLIQTADMVQKSTETVRRWVCSYCELGIKFLAVKGKIGRPAKLTKSQLKDLKAMLENNPGEHGYPTGCWNAALIRDLISKHFGVTFSVKYLPELLKRIGLSYQKAKFMLNKSCSQARTKWLSETWPKLHRRAKRNGWLILIEDEASFAMWGSLSYTWAVKGQQPEIPTSGNRKNLKVFGAIDYFTGKLFYRTVKEQLNARSYVDFLKQIVKGLNQKAILIHDGAPYHKSKVTTMYATSPEAREKIELHRLPAYSPDFNPIEGLWRNVKRGFTHNRFFETFEDLCDTVSQGMRSFQKRPNRIIDLCGFYTKM